MYICAFEQANDNFIELWCVRESVEIEIKEGRKSSQAKSNPDELYLLYFLLNALAIRIESHEKRLLFKHENQINMHSVNI